MCQSYADNWDSIIPSISGTAPSLAEIQSMQESGVLTGQQAVAVNNNRVNGCVLADVVSLTTSTTADAQSATIDAEVNIPGTEPVSVAVEFTFDGGGSKLRNPLLVTDGDTLSASYTDVSTGSHTLCADIVTVEAL